MELFTIHYTNLQKRIEEILQFIHAVSNQKNFIDLCKGYPELAQHEFLAATRELINSTVQYNAVVISCYSCFEHFVDELLSQYVRSVYEEFGSMDYISSNAKEKYVRVISDYLSNPQRYSGFDVSRSQVIDSLHNNFCGKSNFMIEKFLLKHGGNLKQERLNTLLNELGIENLINSLRDHPVLKRDLKEMEESEIATEVNNTPQRILYYLDELVDIRNSISHGWIDDERLSYEKLGIHARLIMLLAHTICDIVLGIFIAKKYEHGRLASIGKAIGFFDDHIVCINSGDHLFSSGDYIYYRKGSCYGGIARIVNIQIDRHDVAKTEVINIDLGLELDRRIKEGCSFYVVRQ